MKWKVLSPASIEAFAYITYRPCTYSPFKHIIQQSHHLLTLNTMLLSSLTASLERCKASVQTLWKPVDATLRVNRKISVTDDNQKNLVFCRDIFCSLYPVSSEVWHSDTWDLCFTQKRQPRLHTHIVHMALQPSTLTSLCPPRKLIPAEWHIFSGEMTVVHAAVCGESPA